MKKQIIFLAAATFFAAQVSAADVYVKAGATGNGTSWNDAKGDLSRVLFDASAGTTVHVAAGDYKPTCNFNGETANNREFRFKLGGGVTVLGGYPANGEGERDPKANLTVLNGDLGNGTKVYTVAFVSLGSEMAVVDGVTIQNGKGDSGDHFGDFSGGAGAIILKGGGNALEGSSPVGMGLRLANCTIKDCTANWGGAMKLMKPDGQTDKIRLEIENCNFTNNTGGQSGAGLQANGYDIVIKNTVFANNETPQSGNNGGAVCAWDSKITIEKCTFTANGAGSNGGAIFSENGQELTVTESSFTQNYAWEGGAIRYNQTDGDVEQVVTFTSCDFVKNTDARENGNGSGGGVNLNGWNSLFVMNDCLFDQNVVGNAGGAMRINGKFNIENCRFIKNQAGAHAGSWVDGPEAIMKNCIFDGNISTGNAEGTAMKGQVGTLTLENCHYYNNIGFSILGIGWNSNATLKDISIYNNTATALAFQNAVANIDNIVISGNKSMSKGAVINCNWEGTSNITIKNGTIVNNRAAQGQTNIYKAAGECYLTFVNTLFSLNKIGDAADATDYTNIEGISVDPQYTLLNNTLKQDADDFFGTEITPLVFGSTISTLEEVEGVMVHKLMGENNPLIGAGDPAMAGTMDILGNERPAAPAIGALEASPVNALTANYAAKQVMQVYPCPAANDFYLSADFGTSRFAQVTITSADGKQVARQMLPVSEGTITCHNDLCGGLYIITVNCDNMVYNGTLIVK